MGNADLRLTVDETREVTAALVATLEPYRGRTLADRLMNMVPHRRH